MCEDSKKLYQIGEVAKLVGVSRRILLNYEDCGLVVPDYKNDKSGYRYYSVDTLYHIRLIRSLQRLGLSLTEIASYFADTSAADGYLKRLCELRDSIDNSIELLRQRAVGGSFEWTTLERRVCCRYTHVCADVAQATNALRDDCAATIARGMMLSGHSRLFSIQEGSEDGMLHINFFVPVEEDTATPDCIVFPETAAVSLYHRGGYEGIPALRKKVADYVQSNNIKKNGDVQVIYIEGPPTHKDNTSAYISQIAAPAFDRRKKG